MTPGATFHPKPEANFTGFKTADLWFCPTYEMVSWSPKRCIMQQFHDDVTGFKICKFHKNTKIYISRERNIIFSSNKKTHWLLINGYFIKKSSSVAEVTFKNLSPEPVKFTETLTSIIVWMMLLAIWKNLRLLDIKAKSPNLNVLFPLICCLLLFNKINRLHPMQLIQMEKQHLSLKNQTKVVF